MIVDPKIDGINKNFTYLLDLKPIYFFTKSFIFRMILFNLDKRLIH